MNLTNFLDIVTGPFILFLHYLNQITGNFGLAIIALTLIIRAILIPLTLPAMSSQKKIRDLAPQIAALKKQFGKDTTGFGKAQMELYKRYSINPLSGCLPYLLQFVVLILLYQVLQRFIHEGAQGLIANVQFLGINLTQKDTSFILPVLAGGLQLLLSLMLLPGLESHDLYPKKNDSGKKGELDKANKKETETQDMAVMMQRQMMFVFPVMTGVFAASFPAGLALYWVISTAFSVIQQYFVSGWGGLAKYLPKAIRNIEPKTAGTLEVFPTGERVEEATIVSRQPKKTKSEVSFAEAFAKAAQNKKKKVPSQVQKTKQKNKKRTKR